MELNKLDKMRLFQQITGWSIDKIRANKKQINALLNDESISFIEQELTEEQKAQARRNINAANDSEVVKHVSQNLTSEQQAQVRKNIDVLSMIETFGYLQSLGIDASYDDYIEWVYSQNPLKRPLTVEATEDNTAVMFHNTPRIENPDIFGEEMTIEFSIDNGRTWSNVNSTEGLICILNAGEKVELRGNNSCYNGHQITMYKECYLYGNIMSMLSSNNFEALDTIEENYCFAGFFANNYYLNKEDYDIYLPATTLSAGCYDSMFKATRITKAPELPATTLTTGCYARMFATCFSLTSCPNLPSINIADGCYFQMFMDCTHLTSVPELPATILKTACYQSMFEGCTSLVNAQKELPANTLAQSCYDSMFKGCTELKESPLLCDVAQLAADSYKSMFEDCSNLEKATLGIKATLTNSSIATAFTNFLKNVSSVGILMLDLVSENYPTQFVSRGSTIRNWEVGFYNALIIKFNGSMRFVLIDRTHYRYSKNGNGWSTNTGVNVTDSDTIYVKGSTVNTYIQVSGIFSIASTNEDSEIYLSGDIAGVLRSNGVLGNNKFAISNLINQNDNVTRSALASVSELKLLPESNMDNSCYENLFKNCGKLVDAPKLPAINLTSRCYCRMFISCVSLRSAPELPAKTLVNMCYEAMFAGCTSLSYIKALFDEPNDAALTSWLTDVASTGTYVKSKDATYEPTTIGVPQDWTIETADA